MDDANEISANTTAANPNPPNNQAPDAPLKSASASRRGRKTKSSSPPSPSLAVVIPVFHDEENIAELKQRLPPILSQTALPWEIILVDDATPGLNTWLAITAWANEDHRIKGIRLAHNLTSQGAILVGLQHCSSTMAVMMDSDLQDPPELIPAMLSEIQAGYDVVYGTCKKRRENILYRILRRLFYFLLSLGHGRWYPPAGNFCCLGPWALQAAQGLKTIPFWRVWRKSLAGRQKGIPFVRPPRFKGKSNNHLISNLRWAGYAFVAGPNFLPEYFLLGGTLFIAFITVLHPGVWPVMVLAEFFLLLQYFILRYLALLAERFLGPWPLADKVNLK